jgi:hypothetical protein
VPRVVRRDGGPGWSRRGEPRHPLPAPNDIDGRLGTSGASTKPRTRSSRKSSSS